MRRTAGTLLAIVTVYFAACDGNTKPAGPAISFGVNSSIEWWGGELNEGNRRLREFEAQRAPELGGLVRMGFRHGEIERSTGEYDFAWHDESVDSFRANGSQILGVLIGSVPWAVASPKHDISQLGFYPPDDPADFGRFAGIVADHFRGRVAAWEIWNEPNILFFWSPTPDASKYAALLREAIRAIRAADPSAQIISGAMAPAPPLPPLFLSDVDFLDAMFAAEPSLASALDGVGIHLYGNYPPQSPPEENGADYRGRVRSLKAVLERNHANELPLYATEFGFCSGGADPHTGSFRRPRSEAERGGPLDSQTHAAYLVRAAVLLTAEGVTTLVPWVMLDHGPQFRTFAAISTFECERTFGMFEGTDPSSDPPAREKPAARAWKDLTSALAGARFESDASPLFHDSTVAAFRFARGGDAILVAYRQDGTTALSPPLRLGRRRWVESFFLGADGTVTVTAGDPVSLGPMPVVLVYR